MNGKRTFVVSVLIAALAFPTAFLIVISKTAYADIVTIQPSSADAYIDRLYSTYNYGSSSYLNVRSYTRYVRLHYDRRSLVQFDLSSVPAEATIQEANLMLYMSTAPSTSRTYEAYPVTSEWTEASVKWNNQPSIAASPTDSTGTGTTSGVWLSWDITANVKAWHSGSEPNFGTLIKDAQEGSSINYVGTFYSKEYATASLRPKLEVTYITGPEFSISATPPSQTVSSGASTAYTVTLTSMGGFSELVSLSVTDLPADTTGTFDPPTVTPTGASTLTVSTDVTTPGGIYTLTITGTNGGLTHSTTVELVVVGPESFTFEVRPGTTQIVVTVIWTGQGTNTILLQNSTTTYTEADMIVYEKKSVDVGDGGTKTYANIKRALLAITAPSTTESWTLLLSLSGMTTYQVNLETA